MWISRFNKPNLYRPPSSRNRSQGGFALVAVLLFLMVVTAAITPFVLAARTDISIAAGQYSNDRLNLLAEGMASLAAHQLSVPPEQISDTGLAVNSQPIRSRCGNILVEMVLQDQSGLVDLNAAPTQLLEAGFSALNVPSANAGRLATIATFYRTAGNAASLPRIRPEELAEGLKHGPFEAIEELYELRQLSGIPVSRLAEIFTVWGRSPAISARNMSLVLAGVLPDQPTARHPYIIPDAPDFNIVRIEVNLGQANSNASGFAGSIVELQRDESGGFKLLEILSNPSFLAAEKSAFVQNTACADLFGPEAASWIAGV